MFNLKSEIDYALIILSHLYKKNQIVSLSDLINETKLPQRYLARIAADLVKNGLLISREGRVGGYQITDKVKKISLYDFLKEFQGDLFIAKCSDKEYCCQYEKICDHKHFFTGKLNLIFKKELQKIKLTNLFE